MNKIGFFAVPIGLYALSFCKQAALKDAPEKKEDGSKTHYAIAGLVTGLWTTAFCAGLAELHKEYLSRYFEWTPGNHEPLTRCLTRWGISAALSLGSCYAILRAKELSAESQKEPKFHPVRFLFASMIGTLSIGLGLALGFNADFKSLIFES